MSNPLLSIVNAGYGETPECENARFARGDVVRVRRQKHLMHIPEELVVLVAVPPGFSPDWALADLTEKPRPALARVGSRSISYILCEQEGKRPVLLKESHLRKHKVGEIYISSVAMVVTND